MYTTPHIKRWIVTGLLASTLVALAAPAFADVRRYKGVQAAPQRVYVRDRSSNVGPVLAGIVGGFILGAAVSSNAHPVAVHERYYEPAYRYYDPYGDDWYDSLDECRFMSGGPQVVFVIDVRSGHRLRELQYRQGRWNRCSDGSYASWAGSRGYRYSERRGRGRDDDGRRYRSNDEGDRRYRSNDDGDRRYRGRERGDN